MSQTFHLEALPPDAGRSSPAVRRVTVRLDGLPAAERRAVELLRRSQVPQWDAGPVEAVRVLDGAGAELFRWTVWDEMTARR